MSGLPANYDVVIVGFGPMGALAANVLGRQGRRARAGRYCPDHIPHIRPKEDEVAHGNTYGTF